MILYAAFILVVFFYSLASRRLERTVLTAPIVFTLAGMGASLLPKEWVGLSFNREGFLLIAEMGLVMTLFTDATHIGLGKLSGNRNLPLRLLTTGMLLTILLGGVLALVVLNGLSVWEAGILAAILAPTDAGLGAVIVNSPLVPPRVAQALNVEAGLNDGLSVPFLMCFIALGLESAVGPGLVLTRFLWEQLGYGGLIGLGIGLAGGWLLGLAKNRQWMSKPLQQLGLVALPILCSMASEATGASMFIAAYVAGFAVQAGFDDAGAESGEFTESWGQLFDFFVFFLFGLLFARAWPQFACPIWLYAVLSLTAIRMIPVAVALLRTGLSPSTVLFMGWFGPRGLASIVLGTVYLEQEANLPGEQTVKLAVMATVLLSIFAHGLTALPGISLYARKIATLDPNAPERQGIPQ